MNNISKSSIISISLPSLLAKEVQASAQKRGRSRSQIFQQAVKQYLWLEQWKELQGYGIDRAREQGFELDNVERLVNEYRAEQKNS